MKGKIIAYWVTTLCFSGFMAFSAFSYLTHNPKMVAAFDALGYPRYLMNLLGIAKTLGVVAILLPGFPRLKEWAYAGFTFVLIGATWSHLATNQIPAVAMPVANALLLAVSYCCRPLNRRTNLTPGNARSH